MNIDLQKFNTQATPFYYYDMALLDATLERINAAIAEHPVHVHYAIKANSNTRILKKISAAGFGADCVSGYEIEAAIAAGFDPKNIVYAGVGKTDNEIRTALRRGIGCINVESIEELEIISQLAAAEGITAPIALRINPDIDAHTHEYITTGLEENKFGIDHRMLPLALETLRSLPALELIGLHFHIGSQITITKPFVLLCERVNIMLKLLRIEGFNIRFIDLGGGLGIDYDNPDENPFSPFAELVDTLMANLKLASGQSIHIEPGRSVVAQCGTLISRVLYVKNGLKRKFLILDAGMTDLIRPALYGAYHLVENLTAQAQNTDKENETYEIVGPVCESTDVFAKDRLLPISKRGDLIAIRSAGAYGQVMASCYNMRPLAPAIFSDEI